MHRVISTNLILNLYRSSSRRTSAPPLSIASVSHPVAVLRRDILLLQFPPMLMRVGIVLVQSRSTIHPKPLRYCCFCRCCGCCRPNRLRAPESWYCIVGYSFAFALSFARPLLPMVLRDTANCRGHCFFFLRRGCCCC